MKKLLVTGLCVLAFSANAFAAEEMQGMQGMHKDTMHKTTKHMKSGKHMGTVGSANSHRGIPGSTNAGGSSPVAPNTVQPGSSDVIPGIGANTR